MACTSYSAGTSAQVVPSLGTIVTNPCPNTLQQVGQAIVNALTLTLPSNFATFSIGSDTPSVANQDKLWFKVDSSTCAPIGWYIYNGGAWVRATGIGTPPGMIAPFYLSTFQGILARDRSQISYIDTGDTYPGGATTALHANPFWLLCDGVTVSGYTPPDLQGRTVVGAGAGSGLTTRAYDATGGLETVTLTLNEIPAIPVGAAGTNGIAQGSDTQAATVVGGGQSHQNMPPFRCLYYAIRTSRTI